MANAAEAWVAACRRAADTHARLLDLAHENVLLRLLVDAGIRERAVLRRRALNQQEQIRSLMGVVDDGE